MKEIDESMDKLKDKISKIDAIQTIDLALLNHTKTVF